MFRSSPVRVGLESPASPFAGKAALAASLPLRERFLDEHDRSRIFWERMEARYLDLYRAVAHASLDAVTSALSARGYSLAKLLFAVSLCDGGRRFLRDFIPGFFDGNPRIDPEILSQEVTLPRADTSRMNVFAARALPGSPSHALDLAETVSQESLLSVIVHSVEAMSRRLQAQELHARTDRMMSGLKLNQVNLLTYNVWGGPPLIGGLDPSRYEEIGRRIRRSDLQVVALQEMWGGKTKSIVTEAEFPHVATAGAVPKFLHGTGLAIMSRLPIVSQDHIVFAANIGGRSAYKGVLFVRLELPDHSMVDVYNVHLYSQGNGDSVRGEQIAELRQMIDRKRTHGIPVMVMGDFNTDELASNYQQMTSQLGMDVYREVHGKIPAEGALDSIERGITFAPERNKWARRTRIFVSGASSRRLDYVFIDGLKSEQAFILNSGLAFSAADHHGRHLSDHFGVSSSLVKLD